MKRNEIISEFKKGVRAIKYNRKTKKPDPHIEPIKPEKAKPIHEQRSDYTKDEIVAILTGRKTQAEVDAEALKTRGPDKGATQTPPPKPAQPKEDAGQAIGKVAKVTPGASGKEAEIEIQKPDNTTVTVPASKATPTATGQLQIDAPDPSEIKPGAQVISKEDMMAPPTDSRSPIHGDEDHDEVSKLLVQKLRKLAGLQEQPAAPAANQIPAELTVQGMINDPEAGFTPDEKAYMQKMLIAHPNGTVDLARTVRNFSGELINQFPQLVDMFKDLQTEINNFIRTPEFSELAPADQNSIIEVGKALPTTIQQIQSTTMQMAKFHDKEFNKMDAATGQYGDGQVEEADAGETTGQDIPPMPDISGLQPGQAKDLGGGQKVTIAPDGNVHLTGGFGSVVYSPQGKPLSYNTPNFGGAGMKQDFSTGNTTTSFNVGPLSTSQTKNAQGQTISSKGNYNFGHGSVNVDQAYKDGQPTIQTRTGTGSLANADLVKNQDTLNKARQARPTSEDQQLEAMLRIAGLR